MLLFVSCWMFTLFTTWIWILCFRILTRNSYWLLTLANDDNSWNDRWIFLNLSKLNILSCNYGTFIPISPRGVVFYKWECAWWLRTFVRCIFRWIFWIETVIVLSGMNFPSNPASCIHIVLDLFIEYWCVISYNIRILLVETGIEYRKLFMFVEIWFFYFTWN